MPLIFQFHEAPNSRGVAPADTIGLAIGVDTGKRELHWECKAVRPDGSMIVIEYAVQRVPSDTLGVYQGLLSAIKELTTYFERGWSTEDGRNMRPGQVWIDSGWHEHTEAIYSACIPLNRGCREGKERYRPAKGYGEGQRRGRGYDAPKQKSNEVVWIGRECYLGRVMRKGRKLRGVLLLHINSDHWKSEFHQRLSIPSDQPGAITLYEPADPHEHAEYALQITAEKQVEKMLPKSRRTAIVWERVERHNHYLGAGYLATAAGYHMCFDWLGGRRKI